MKTIQLKDKVLSHEQFSNLMYAINGLFAGNIYDSKMLRFSARPVHEGPTLSAYSDIRFEADDPIELPLRGILQAFGFIERPPRSDETTILANNPAIRSQVKSHVQKAMANSREKILWVVWYDLNDQKDISLLYIAEEVILSEDGLLESYSMIPGWELRIPGSLRICMTSAEELEAVRRLNPSQRPILCLQNGDYTIVESTDEKSLKNKIAWIGNPRI